MVDCMADCIAYGGLHVGLYCLWWTAWRIVLLMAYSMADYLLMVDCMADCVAYDELHGGSYCLWQSAWRIFAYDRLLKLNYFISISELIF
jgi:hypothetical protein